MGAGASWLCFVLSPWQRGAWTSGGGVGVWTVAGGTPPLLDSAGASLLYAKVSGAANEGP